MMKMRCATASSSDIFFLYRLCLSTYAKLICEIMSICASRGGTGLSTSSSERAEAEVAVEQAWSELAAVEREQESARTERERVERQLEQVRLRGAQLEQVTQHIETQF